MEDNKVDARGNMQATAIKQDDYADDDQKPAWTPSPPWSMVATAAKQDDDNDDLIFKG
jgi:hypothetical protein